MKPKRLTPFDHKAKYREHVREMQRLMGLGAPEEEIEAQREHCRYHYKRGYLVKPPPSPEELELARIKKQTAQSQKPMKNRDVHRKSYAYRHLGIGMKERVKRDDINEMLALYKGPIKRINSPGYAIAQAEIKKNLQDQEKRAKRMEAERAAREAKAQRLYQKGHYRHDPLVHRSPEGKARAELRRFRKRMATTKNKHLLPHLDSIFNSIGRAYELLDKNKPPVLKGQSWKIHRLRRLGNEARAEGFAKYLFENLRRPNKNKRG